MAIGDQAGKQAVDEAIAAIPGLESFIDTQLGRILGEFQAIRLELARTNDLIEAYSKISIPAIAPRKVE